MNTANKLSAELLSMHMDGKIEGKGPSGGLKEEHNDSGVRG
jgi:hypothetical protein